MVILMAAPAGAAVVVAWALARRGPVVDGRVGALALIPVAVLLEVVRAPMLAAVADPVVLNRCFAAADLVLAALLIRANRSLPAVTSAAFWVCVTAVGVVLNAIPVLLTGAMPFGHDAALASGIPEGELSPPPVGYVDASEVPGLAAALGDRWPIPTMMKVLSVGDTVMLVGLTMAIGVLWAGLLLRHSDEVARGGVEHEAEA